MGAALQCQARALAGLFVGVAVVLDVVNGQGAFAGSSSSSGDAFGSGSIPGRVGLGGGFGSFSTGLGGGHSGAGAGSTGGFGSGLGGSQPFGNAGGFGRVAGGGGGFGGLGAGLADPGVDSTQPSDAVRDLLTAKDDVSDLLYGGGDVGDAREQGSSSPGSKGASPKRAKGVSAKSASEQKRSIAACFREARKRLEEESPDIMNAVASLMAQGASRPGQEFDEEQATNQVVFSMVFACSDRIKNDTIQLILDEDGRPSGDAVQSLFTASSPPRPSRRQFRFLEEVMGEERERMVQAMSQVETLGGVATIGRGFSAPARICYVTLVVGGLSAAGIWSYLHVSSKEKLQRHRTDKAMRRVKSERSSEKKKA